MPKQESKTPTRSTNLRIEGKSAKAAGLKTAKNVTFGGVTVSAYSQTKKVVRKNIVDGQSALKRAAASLLRPGVALRLNPDVPLYHVDENDPETIIRELNGKREKGVVLSNGRFKVK